MLRQVLYILACLLLPIVWGVVVHALFHYLDRRRTPEDDDVFPDYQI